MSNSRFAFQNFLRLLKNTFDPQLAEFVDAKTWDTESQLYFKPRKNESNRLHLYYISYVPRAIPSTFNKQKLL